MSSIASLSQSPGVSEADVLARLRDFPLWVNHGIDDTLTRYDAANSPFRVMNALNGSGTTVVYNEVAATLPVAETNPRTLALLGEAKKKGAKHLFTTYSAGTNPVFGHGSWIPLFMTPAMLDWMFAQVRQPPAQTNTAPAGPRTIVTTDPELDDSNSLVRFLLYTNELTTEGIIYA